jgi:hypothetical protein
MEFESRVDQLQEPLMASLETVDGLAVLEVIVLKS